MNATPSSPKGSYGPPTAASSSADSPNPQPHNAQDELSRQPLRADLNAQDDDGFGWSTLAEAVAPDRVRPGAMLLAGNSQARAVVRVFAVDDDGQVHFEILPGP